MMKFKMEINNNKEIPFDPSKMRFLPQAQSMPVYFFDDQNEELSELREVVRDAVEYLCPQDRFIIEAIYYEQITFEVLGERLGVSNVHAWRLAKTAIKNLQAQLITNEYVNDYLDLGGGFEQE
jgi:RNA polymerase sigma factor (sigma-70 family)